MRALQEVLNAGLKTVRFLAQVQNCSERANNETSQGEAEDFVWDQVLEACESESYSLWDKGFEAG